MFSLYVNLHENMCQLTFNFQENAFIDYLKTLGPLILGD